MPSKITDGLNNTALSIGVRFLRGTGVPEGIGGHEHSHDFTELVVVYGGQGIHRVDGHDYPVASGNVFVVLGDQTHAIVQRQDMQYVEVAFNPDRFQLPVEYLQKLPGYHALFVLEPYRRRRGQFQGHLQLSPTKLGEAMRIINNMDREFQERIAGYEALLLSYLIDLMVFLSREYSHDSHGEAKALLKAGEIISILEHESAKDWQLKELCEASHMSKSRLLTVFKEATSKTPIEYLIQVRLRNAMQLLKETDFTVTEIAYRVGFSDSNYFARQFRKVLGMSPVEYRRQSV